MRNDGQLTLEEFGEAALAFFEHTLAYNKNSSIPINIELIRMPEDCYFTIGGVFLELWGRVQIFYSHTFCVPVMYFNCSLSIPLSQEGFNSVRTSYIEHPITGLPCCYVHPCQVAKVLTELSSSSYTSPKDYLLKWFGIYHNYIPKSIGELPPAFFVSQL